MRTRTLPSNRNARHTMRDPQLYPREIRRLGIALNTANATIAELEGRLEQKERFGEVLKEELATERRINDQLRAAASGRRAYSNDGR